MDSRAARLKDGVIPDSSWPPASWISNEEWRNISANFEKRSRTIKCRREISSLISGFRYQLGYLEGEAIPAALEADFRKLAAATGALRRFLEEPTIRNALNRVDNLRISLSPCKDASDVARLNYAESLSAAVGDADMLVQIALASCSKERKWRGLPFPKAKNPALARFIVNLIAYWELTLGGPSANTLDETQDPIKASKLTLFVKACLDAAGAVDRNGNALSIGSVHQHIKRTRRASRSKKRPASRDERP